MKLGKILANPFLLTGQGFVIGALLFFATHPTSLEAGPTKSEMSTR